MNILQEVQELAVKKVSQVSVGNTVVVHQKIKEGEKERVQLFEGLVISVNSGHGADKTITVRKVVEGIGVEKIFALYSTNIVKIEIKKKSKIRRAKLYYMRERTGKSARLKETFVSQEESEANEMTINEQKEEAQVEDPSETPNEEPPAEDAK
jgi:large subunit ribosomal protein L19